MDIVPRGRWGFQGPLGPPMQLPSRGAWAHHSVTRPTSSPAADMRTLERIGHQRFGRLSYSFGIHPYGVVLEGQGHHIGAHTAGQNSTSHGIVLIGNYEADEVPEPMLEALIWLLRRGRDEGWWETGKLLGGHRDAPDAETACPGGNAHQLIPHINRRVLEDDVQEADIEAIAERAAQKLLEKLQPDKGKPAGKELDTLLRYARANADHHGFRDLVDEV